jgi:ribonuclease BN (tRNA processing enzyme)
MANDSSAAASAKAKLRITIFGSAAGFPTQERTTTAIGLWRDGDLYLFDAGEPVAAHLARRRVSPDALRAVFITHLHADHSAGLPMLMQWLQLNHRARPLSLHLPSTAVGDFAGVLDMHYLFPDDLGFALEMRGVEGGRVYEAGDISVVALANRHLDGQAEKARRGGRDIEPQSFSYLVAVDGKRVLFSGDLAQPTELVVPAAGADLAIVELAHFTPEALGQALAATKLPRLVVTHLIHTLEPVEDQVCNRIRAAGFGGGILLARDGEEISL